MGSDNRKSRIVASNKWDEETLQRVLNDYPALVATIDQLGCISTAAPDLAADIFHMLYKAIPDLAPVKEIRDNRRVNHAIVSAFPNDEEYEPFHDLCIGDPIGAAMALVGWGPKLESMLQRFYPQQERLEELEKQREKLEEMEAEDEQLGEDARDEDDEDEAGNQLLEQQQLVEQLEHDVERDMLIMELSTEAAVSSLINDGTEQLEAQAAMAGMLGGYGEGELHNVPLSERFRLNELVDSELMRYLAQFFGALDNLRAPHQKITPDLPDELTGVTLGDDISRLLSDQLALMKHPKLKPLIVRDLLEKQALVYEYMGMEEIGKGAILVVVDESLSVVGEGYEDKHALEKSVALMCMTIAREQGRLFHAIHFDTQAVEQTFTYLNLTEGLELVDTALGGGTAYKAPLEKAMAYLEAEKTDRSDIVFLTDGEPNDMGRNSPNLIPWVQDFRKRLDKVGGMVWSIAVGRGARSPQLQAVSDRVIDIEDIRPGGTKDVKEIFDGIQKPRKRKVNDARPN